MLKLFILALTIATFFYPNAGSIFFIVIAFILEINIFLMNLSKIKIKNDANKYTQEEEKVIGRYHLFFRYPMASRSFSAMLSAIQISALILVPWLLFKELYAQAITIGLNYFIAGQFAVILNPQFFLHDNLDKNKIKDPKMKLVFKEDMDNIDSALEKMYLDRNTEAK